MRIRYRLEKEIKDFPEQKIVNYPELLARHYPTKFNIYMYICDNTLDSRVEMYGRFF